MIENLEHFFKENFTTSEKEISEVVKYFKHKSVAKGEIIVNSGLTCRYLFFVVKGCLKASFIDSRGIETIRYVAFENQFISTLHSFIKQTPATEYITAVEVSDLLAIAYTDFKTGLNKIPLCKDFYIGMLEETYLHNHWRIETFLQLDAKQRYEYILKKNAQLVQRLSNKNLSRFLGITQESLSRIKSKK